MSKLEYRIKGEVFKRCNYLFTKLKDTFESENLRLEAMIKLLIESQEKINEEMREKIKDLNVYIYNNEQVREKIKELNDKIND